jgi:beta-lactamase class D
MVLKDECTQTKEWTSSCQKIKNKNKKTTLDFCARHFVTTMPKIFDSKYQEYQANTNVYNLHFVD